MLIIGYLLHLLYTYTYTDLRVDALLYLLSFTIVGEIFNECEMNAAVSATVMLPYFSFACCLNGIQINEMASIGHFRHHKATKLLCLLVRFLAVWASLAKLFFLAILLNNQWLHTLVIKNHSDKYANIVCKHKLVTIQISLVVSIQTWVFRLPHS